MRWEIFLLITLFSLTIVSAISCDEAGLISYWRFDQQISGIFPDSAGDNNLKNDGARLGVGKINKALSVTANDKYAYIDPLPENLKLSGNFTIEAWVKLNSISPDSDSYVIYAGSRRYAIKINGSSKKPEFYWNDALVVRSDIALNLNEWYHIAVVKNGSSFTLYVNGTGKNSTSSDSVIYGSNEVLYVGWVGDGSVDEVAIYNHSLSAVEINSHYSNPQEYCSSSPPTYATGGNSTTVHILVPGCREVPGFKVGLHYGECSADGKYFCTEDGLFNTLTTDICWLYDPMCCPRGYKCVESGCVLREYECDYWTTKEKCENHSCVWLGSICVDPYSGLSCSNYTTEEACENDPYELGKKGFGTDICYKRIEMKTVEPGSCRCEWNGTDCLFVYNVSDIIFSDTRHFFECLKTFNLSECVNGVQTLSWTATVTNVQPADWDQSSVDSVAENFECVPGSKQILCGGPIVKLPGFSRINIILILLILGIFYFVKKN